MTLTKRSRIDVYFLLIFSFIFSICGCTQKKEQSQNSYSNESNQYATGFRIEQQEEYTKIIINNPWSESNQKPYAIYYLYNQDSTSLPEDGFHLKIPISSVIINTFSYFEFLNQLNELDKVVGVSDASRIYNPIILEKINEGKITDLGDPFNPNLEKSLMLQSDAVVTSAFAQQDTYNERVINTGIPVIYSLEWMERSPLARAEWIKLIAAFFDKSEIADSIFNEIEQRYLNNKKIAEKVSNKPYILAGDNFQDTWYMPGGNSFNANLFKDAGIDYFHKNNKEQGSIGFNIETVLLQFGNADLWVGCEADSYKELERKDKKYMLLQPVKQQKVFNNRKRITAAGGNDYFESAILFPDQLLKDLIKAAHPELMSTESFTYLKPLN